MNYTHLEMSLPIYLTVTFHLGEIFQYRNIQNKFSQFSSAFWLQMRRYLITNGLIWFWTEGTNEQPILKREWHGFNMEINLKAWKYNPYIFHK